MTPELKTYLRAHFPLFVVLGGMILGWAVVAGLLLIAPWFLPPATLLP